jgi:hypothetical protein
MLARLCVLVLLGGGALILPASAASSGFLVRKSQLECVIDNLDKYLNSGTDPIVIYLNICPQLTLTPDMIARMAVNELPRIGRGVQDSSSPETVLALTKADLICLRDVVKTLKVTGENVHVPAELCRQ